MRSINNFLFLLLALTITSCANAGDSETITHDAIHETKVEIQEVPIQTIEVEQDITGDKIVESPAEQVVSEHPEVPSENTENNATSSEEQLVEEVAEPEIEAEVSTEAEEESEEDQRDSGAILMWDALLQKYVDNSGNVNYKGLKEDKSFELCMSTFSNMHPDESWETAEELAFWINVYNIYTVKLIVDNYPVKSIKDINDPWGKSFVKLKNNSYSLGQIENDILRPKFNDPRVHFAINCASVSCPKLQSRAFFSMSLDKMLDQVTRDFIGDSKHNKISETEVKVSKIFEWYMDDFTVKGPLLNYLRRYSKLNIESGTEITYLEYDWNLNSK
jgi:hypothetical protein